jgi:N-acetylmuramoyl-L-alanine amidase
MADSPAQHDLKLKRAILKEVYLSNLEEANKPRPAARAKQSGYPSWVKNPLLFLALLPMFGILLYILLPLPLNTTAQFAGTPVSPPPTASEVGVPHPMTVSNPLATVGISSIATLTRLTDPLPDSSAAGLELGDNLPQNYEALLPQSQIPLAQLFGLDAKTIVIDPGHGGRDPGAIGANGLQEKDVTLAVALLLRDRLKQHPGYRILMTRDKDVRISTRERVAFANSNKADLFISIHCNSLDKLQLNIIETYYFGAQADEESLRLAETENQGSEYLMAEFKGMIKKIGDNFKQQESNALATSIQNSLFRQMKAQDEKVVNRGTKMAPFVVLLGADMPSVLAEITCISNPEEEKKLADPEYLETFAQYLEGGIVGYLNRTHSNATNATNGVKQNGEERRANGKG